MEKKHVFVGMSGGVDSSVAAYRMLSAGFDCIGATMRLYDGEEDDGTCCSLADVEDARSVAQKMGIPHYVFNFKEDFKNKVIADFVCAYENGLTPNPCIQCNQHLKFRRLLDRALELGCDYVVSGHYAQVKQDPDSGRYLLYKAADRAKDHLFCA